MRALAQLRLRALPIATNAFSLAGVPSADRVCPRCPSPGQYDDKEHLILHCRSTLGIRDQYCQLFQGITTLRQFLEQDPCRIAPPVYAAISLTTLDKNQSGEGTNACSLAGRARPMLHDKDNDDDLEDTIPSIDFDNIRLDPSVKIRLRCAPPPFTMTLRSSQSSQSSPTLL